MKRTTFWKKLDLAFWMLVLLALSAGAAVTIIIVEQPLTPRSEYLPMLIIGTLGIVFLVGLIAFFIYRYLKSNHSDVALKRALQVYGIIVTGMLLYGSLGFKKALETRDKHEYLEAYRPLYMEMMMEKIEKDHPGNKVVKDHLERIAHYSYNYIVWDEELYKGFKAAKNKKAFISNNKDLQADVETCIEMCSRDNPYEDLLK